MLKRVAVMLFCLMMIFIATFGFVVGVIAVPTIYSYAETTNNFEPIRDQSDAVYAFQAYCKSRDLTIEGSITDAVTSYTTDAYNHTCNKIGINPTELQAQIQAEYDQAGKPVKFLFSSMGVDVFNRLFSQFLQDNELQVGDTNVDKNVYDGEIYGGSNIYITTTSSISVAEIPNSNILQRGSHFIYSRSAIIANADNTISFQIGNDTYTYYVTDFTGTTYEGRSAINAVGIVDSSNDYNRVTTNNCVSGRISRGTIWDETFTNGYPVIYTPINSGSYYLGIYYARTDSVSGKSREGIKLLRQVSITSNDATDATVNIISTTINNNTYEGDTIINNEGDVIIEPDPVPPGGTDPGWDIGGGGGTANDGNGNTWNIQFPDFELPDLNIDWSINGLGEKFPFSIPFDLVALVTVLNAEPQAPRFEGTVNFGFTTWDYDINLQQFDTVAQACRIAELLLLVVGLILVTRSIIKG